MRKNNWKCLEKSPDARTRGVLRNSRRTRQLIIARLTAKLRNPENTEHVVQRVDFSSKCRIYSCDIEKRTAGLFDPKKSVVDIKVRDGVRYQFVRLIAPFVAAELERIAESDRTLAIGNALEQTYPPQLKKSRAGTPCA